MTRAEMEKIARDIISTYQDDGVYYCCLHDRYECRECQILKDSITAALTQVRNEALQEAANIFDDGSLVGKEFSNGRDSCDLSRRVCDIIAHQILALSLAGGKVASEENESEEWAPLPDCDGVYQVSNLGRVRLMVFRNRNGACALNPPRIMSVTVNHLGYHCYDLTIRGKRVKWYLGRLVLTAFVGPRPDLHQCAHLDGDPSNNRLSNLKWTSVKENNLHKQIHGTAKAGQAIASAKLTEDQVISMRKKYHYQGQTIGQLSAEFKVSQAAVWRVVDGKSWAHLPLKPDPSVTELLDEIKRLKSLLAPMPEPEKKLDSHAPYAQHSAEECDDPTCSHY